MSSRLGPKPRRGYTDSRIERAAELRTDASAIAALTNHPGAGTYVIGGEWIVAKKGSPLSEPLFTPAEAHELGPAAETIFLGLLDGAPRFGHGLSPQSAEALKSRSDLLVTDLRSIAVQGLIAADDLPPIAEAKAVLPWHTRHPLRPSTASFISRLGR